MSEIEVVRIPVASGGAIAAAIGGADVPVVFEAGSPGDAGTWRGVTPLVRTFARTIAYNRAGYAPSDPLQWPRPLLHAAEDLICVVRAATAEPAVLVAHSAGGPIARLALRQAPELFRGAVLVDTTPLAGLGVIARLEREAVDSAHEFDWDDGQQDCAGLDDPGVLGAMPIAVLRAGRDDIPESAPPWYREFFRDPALREPATQLSSQTRVVDLADCGHNVPAEEPEAVADAVRGIIAGSAPGPDAS